MTTSPSGRFVLHLSFVVITLQAAAFGDPWFPIYDPLGDYSYPGGGTEPYAATVDIDTEAQVAGYLDSPYDYWEGYFHFGLMAKIDHYELEEPLIAGPVDNPHYWGVGSFLAGPVPNWHATLNATLYFLGYDYYDWTVSNQALFSVCINHDLEPWQGDDTLGDTGLFEVYEDMP